MEKLIEEQKWNNQNMQESARRQEEEGGRRRCKGNGETIGHANDEADPKKESMQGNWLGSQENNQQE